MRKTKISTDGTSYFGSSVTATLAQMRKVLGEPEFASNDGNDKTNIEWERETETGLVFTVYDWKYYKHIFEHEDIQWNIGGNSKDATEAARGEIEKALKRATLVANNGNVDIDQVIELMKDANFEDGNFTDEMADFMESLHVCSRCNAVAKEGYVVNDGDEIFCSDQCLNTVYPPAVWAEMSKDDNTENYWTKWTEL